MADAIRFFQQYESAIYFLLAIGEVLFGWRFYKAWQELRGSVFGLEQVGAQRRLNRSAVAIFVIILMGVGVFSLVTFAQPIIDSEAIPEAMAELGIGEELIGTEGEEEQASDPLATATPLPTVEVDPALCDPERINITSPVINEEVRGTVEVTGLVSVDNFGFYMVEWARSDAALWTTIQTNRNLVREEGLLLEWDTSLFPPGSYVIQLVVTDSDGEEYPPCRIPLQIGSQ
jgi:hypothetical protein